MKKLLLLILTITILCAHAYPACAQDTAYYSISGKLSKDTAELITLAFSENATDIKSAVNNDDVQFITTAGLETDGSFIFNLTKGVKTESYNIIVNYSGRDYVRKINETNSVVSVYIEELINSISVDAENKKIEISGNVGIENNVSLSYGESTAQIESGSFLTTFDISDNALMIEVYNDDFIYRYPVDTSYTHKITYEKTENIQHLAHFNLPVNYGQILSGTPDERYNQRVAQIPDEITVIQPFNTDNETEIFVSPKGTDDSNGDINAPVKTIERAMELVKETQKNVTVTLREGTYKLTNSVKIDSFANSASDGGKITSIRSYNGEKVDIISDDVFNISPSSFKATDNIKTLDLNDLGIDYEDPRKLSLLVNGVNLEKSRWPETEEITMGEIINGGNPVTYTSIYDEPLRWDVTRGIYFNGSYVAVGKWDLHTNLIADINAENRQIKVNGYSGYGEARSNPYILHHYTNVIEEIDVPGEWAVDRATGLLYLYPTEEFSESEILIYEGSDTLFDITDAKNIIIDGINFKYANNAVSIYNSEDIIIQNCNFEHFKTDAVIAYNSSYIGVINSKADFCDNTAFNINNSKDFDEFINDEKVYNLIPTRNFVQNCVVSNCGYSAIRLNFGIGDVISHNVITDMKNNGIVIGSSQESVVEYNEISNFAMYTWDSGAVYTAGIPVNRGNHIRYNYIHDSLAGGVGIYFDNMTSDNMAYKNIINDVGVGISVNGGREYVFDNNIILRTEAIKTNKHQIPISYDFSEITPDNMVIAHGEGKDEIKNANSIVVQNGQIVFNIKNGAPSGSSDINGTNLNYYASELKIPYSGLRDTENLRISFKFIDEDGNFNIKWQNFGSIINSDGNMVLWNRRDGDTSGRYGTELGATNQVMIIGLKNRAAGYDLTAKPGSVEWGDSVQGGIADKDYEKYGASTGGNVDKKFLLWQQQHTLSYEINRETEIATIKLDGEKIGEVYIMNKLTPEGYIYFKAHSGNGSDDVQLIGDVIVETFHKDMSGIGITDGTYNPESSMNDSFFIPQFINADGNIQKFMNSPLYESVVWKNRYPDMYIWLEQVKQMLDLRANEGENYQRGDTADTSDIENIVRATSGIYAKNNIFAVNTGVEKNWVSEIWPISGTETNYLYSNGENAGFIDYHNKNFALNENADVFSKIPLFKTIPFEKTGTILMEKIKLETPYVYSIKLNNKEISQVKWKAVKGAYSYTITIAEDEEFDNVIYKTNTKLPYCKFNKDLLSNMYYIKVEAYSQAKAYEEKSSYSTAFLIFDAKNDSFFITSKNDNGNKVEFTLFNDTNSEQKVNVIASYWKDDEFSSAKIIKSTTVKGKSCTTQEAPVKEEQKIVLFVWTDAMKPLCNPIILRQE